MDTHPTQSAAEPSTSDQAKEKAREAAGQAKGTLRSQVDQRSTDAGQRVGGFAADVRCASRARISPPSSRTGPPTAPSDSGAT